jgi:hypothetical protein
MAGGYDGIGRHVLRPDILPEKTLDPFMVEYYKVTTGASQWKTA